jgi:copper chaperone
MVRVLKLAPFEQWSAVTKQQAVLREKTRCSVWTFAGKGDTMMEKITLKINDMMCGMCEAHVNEVIRKNFAVKKVTSSHVKGITVILTDVDISDEALRAAVNETGYTLTSITREPYRKKGLFHRK